VKKLIGKVIIWILLALFNAVGFWSITQLFVQGSYSLGIIMGIVLAAVDFITFSKKMYPHRYTIPLLIVLFVLSIYPMYYTIEIAFTNYGTGHLFTHKQARSLLLSNYFYIPSNPSTYDYSLFIRYIDDKPSKDFYIIFSDPKTNKQFIVFKPTLKSTSKSAQKVFEGKFFEISGNSIKAKGKRIEFIKEPNGKISRLLVFDRTGKVEYRYFFNYHDPTTFKNRRFFIKNLYMPILRYSQFVDDKGNMVRYNISYGLGKMISAKRKYVHRADHPEGKPSIGGKYSDILNVENGKFLIEKNGVFFDWSDMEKRYFKLIGYISGVGFRNFERIWGDPTVSGPFLKVFGWTFTYAFLSVLLTFAIGLALALILNNPTLRARMAYRTLFIIPWAIPAFISVLVWREGIFNETYGFLNKFVLSKWFHIATVPWLSDPVWAKFSVLLVNLWLGFPYMMTVCLGSLQSIPGELYEAADMDGANRIQTFWRITLPLLLIAVAPLLVGSFAFNFNNFVNIYLLTQGGPPLPNAQTPAGSTDILISYTYKLAFEGGHGQDYGFASAISVIIFFIVASISAINFKFSGALEEVNK